MSSSSLTIFWFIVLSTIQSQVPSFETHMNSIDTGSQSWYSLINPKLFLTTDGAHNQTPKLNALMKRTWVSDNGNGTFTNPVFYDEFSDPDLIRVGDDYYLTGTTMHAMPGLPVLHSRDLVNWKFLGYALEKLDLGPEFRLEVDPKAGSLCSADSPGTQPDRKDGSCFGWIKSGN